MPQTFFTSDLHFGHKNIAKYSPTFRKFDSIEEMDEALIRLWNEAVSKDDVVYDLGDFSFHKKIDEIKRVLRRLNGHHILILGNHDQLIIDNKDSLLSEYKNDENKLFDEIVSYKEMSLQDSNGSWHKLMLFHYPIIEWNKGHYGSIHLYGHLHDELAPIKGKALNICYDLHGKILTIDDIIEYVKDIEPFIHHENKFLTSGDSVEVRKYNIKNLMKLVNE